MTTSERREREQKALREKILKAGRALCAEEGYENVSMRKIAERIEYSPTAIYLHFKDKAELLRAICEETFGKLTATLEEIAVRARSGKTDPLDALNTGLHAYADFGLEHPHEYQLTFASRPEIAGKTTVEFLTGLAEACGKAGKFRKHADAQETAQALWAAIHGVTSLLIVGRGLELLSKKKLVNRVVDSMVEGLRKR